MSEQPSARDELIRTLNLGAGVVNAVAEETADHILKMHAHELAEQIREIIPADAPAWVKVIPDLIDPEVPR